MMKYLAWKFVRLPLLALAAAVLVETASAQSPAVVLSKTAYRTGENIVAAFTNGPANAKDWIGIYPEGVTPGSVDSTLWYYVDGTRNGDTGLAEGVITFTNGLTRAGAWMAYLLENDGYTVLASQAFSVTPSPAITTDKTAYATNETISVTFTNAPGNTKDWIGIYPEGVTPGSTPATIWFYLDGTSSGTTATTNGVINFTGGLANSGRWVAYLLENDGYTVLSSASFTVGDAQGPSWVQPEHSTYYTAAPITVVFTNGAANPKDWIGIYPEGSVPGGPAATIWQYTDAASGTSARTNGAITFSSGLTNTGKYVVYLLENDGYGILATNSLSVVEPTSPLLWLDARAYEAGQPITAMFTNAPGNPKDWIGIYPEGATPGPTPSTIWFYVDGTTAGETAVVSGMVTFQNGLNAGGRWKAYLLENDGYTILAEESFTVTAPEVVPTNNIVLPEPLYFQNFDAVVEGELPAGWTVTNYTEVFDENLNLQDLNSKSFADWVVISASRFTNTFLSYTGQTPTDDYRRVLSFNPQNVVNGVTVSNLASGNFLFNTSGYRSGRSQVGYVYTPAFDLTGRTNVHLSYHSIYEQNQDSIGLVEYSIDGGATWLPVVYKIATGDIIRNEQGEVDVVATLTTEYADVAYYDDPVTGEARGGTYGSFIGAPITQDLAPFISGRVDDNPVESKRVELFRLPQADNRAQVRVRFGHAGVDSWYFGVDNFGLYSLGETTGTGATLSIDRNGNSVTVSWTGGTPPLKLQKATRLAPANWQDVTTPSGATSLTEAISGSAAFYRIVED